MRGAAKATGHGAQRGLQRQTDFSRAAALRDMFPRLAEVRVELRFNDGSPAPPSPQAFSYFPAARGFFRYRCPCHSCDGEFDLSSAVKRLATTRGPAQRSADERIGCSGQRLVDWNSRTPCPLQAQFHIEMHEAGEG